MVTKEEILGFISDISDQNRIGKPICFEDLMDQLCLAYGAALNHLRRLLRERFIEIAGNRPEYRGSALPCCYFDFPVFPDSKL